MQIHILNFLKSDPYDGPVIDSSFTWLTVSRGLRLEGRQRSLIQEDLQISQICIEYMSNFSISNTSFIFHFRLDFNARNHSKLLLFLWIDLTSQATACCQRDHRLFANENIVEFFNQERDSKKNEKRAISL